MIIDLAKSLGFAISVLSLPILAMLSLWYIGSAPVTGLILIGALVIAGMTVLRLTKSEGEI
jgi:ABC-type Mn2+/Zn2+ transport system permease subunit